MSELIDKKELRYRIPWWLWGMAVAALAAMYLAILYSYQSLIYFHIGNEMHTSIEQQYLLKDRGLLVSAIVFAVLGIFLGLRFILLVLEAKRSSITIDIEGLVIVDRRHRRHLVSWNDIKELRVTTCGGLCRVAPVITIITQNQLFRISPWLEYLQLFLELVISKSELKMVSETWYQSRYRYGTL